MGSNLDFKSPYFKQIGFQFWKINNWKNWKSRIDLKSCFRIAAVGAAGRWCRRRRWTRIWGALGASLGRTRATRPRCSARGADHAVRNARKRSTHFPRLPKTLRTRATTRRNTPNNFSSQASSLCCAWSETYSTCQNALHLSQNASSRHGHLPESSRTP